VIHALHGEQDIRRMGGLKKELPITYWTFLVGALAIAAYPVWRASSARTKSWRGTFGSGHTILWVVGVLTSLLTAIYMFRLVFLTFHGPRARRRRLGMARDMALRVTAGGHAMAMRICMTRRLRWPSR